MIPTKIALLTDSSADLRWEEARENNIFFVPLRILCQDGEYLDGVDIRGQDIYRRLRSGELSLLIGTHALFSPDVTYRSLGLVVTDEQHRFGVDQRAALSAKGEDPHLLVMSATPIPRTLALMIYGDLDVSVLDELPPGRQRIDTFAVPSSYHARIYAFLRKLAAEGRQEELLENCPLYREMWQAHIGAKNWAVSSVVKEA